MSYQCPWEETFRPAAGRCAVPLVELPRLPGGMILGIRQGAGLADPGNAACGGLLCASCGLCQTCGRLAPGFSLPPAGEVPARSLRPCGTDAAYKRHRRHGEIPCGDCYAAHSEYCKPYTAASRARVRQARSAMTPFEREWAA